jgi:hypothetical protein
MQVLFENRLKGKLQQGEIQNVEEMLMKEPITEVAKHSHSYKMIKTAYVIKNLERKVTTEKRQVENVNIKSTYKLNTRKNTLNIRSFEQKFQDKGQRSNNKTGINL